MLPFGGNLSVHKPIGSKTVIMLGHNKAICKQFLFFLKMWVGTSGERPLLSKDEGSGTMISAFVCCEHGLIRQISAEILDEVNAQQAGQHYADPEAAIEILGSSNKRPLTSDHSPFLLFFENGENREGYWAYNNMVLQFEDVTDIFKVMYPAYNFVFVFDHGAGQAKPRPDGLNQHQMNRSFGGKTGPMYRSMLLQEQGYLGTFPRVPEPGDTQALLYSSTDTGPFWMSSRGREESRLDQQLGTVTVVKLKVLEMKAQLVENGIADTVGKNARQMKDLCVQHGIPTLKTVSNSLEQN